MDNQLLVLLACFLAVGDYTVIGGIWALTRCHLLAAMLGVAARMSVRVTVE